MHGREYGCESIFLPASFLPPLRMVHEHDGGGSRCGGLHICRGPDGGYRLAVFNHPPYSFKDKKGVWIGLSIELWEEIAATLGRSYKYCLFPNP